MHHAPNTPLSLCRYTANGFQAVGVIKWRVGSEQLELARRHGHVFEEPSKEEEQLSSPQLLCTFARPPQDVRAPKFGANRTVKNRFLCPQCYYAYALHMPSCIIIIFIPVINRRMSDLTSKIWYCTYTITSTTHDNIVAYGLMPLAQQLTNAFHCAWSCERPQWSV